MSHPLAVRDKSILKLREEIKTRERVRQEQRNNLKAKIDANPYLREVLDEYDLQDEVSLAKQRKALANIIEHLHSITLDSAQKMDINHDLKQVNLKLAQLH
jgi:hypothetical protein